MMLALLLSAFQSFLPLPTRKLGPSGADSWVWIFVYFLGPWGFLQRTLLWGWEFLLLPQLSQVFSVKGFEVLFPCTRTLSYMVYLVPQLFFLVILMQMWDHLAHQQPPCLLWSTSLCLALGPLCPCCLSLPLLPVWMNVSSLTPWLLGSHAVWFSGSSGCFCFQIGYYPFGCARRQSVLTYASIWPEFLCWYLVFIFFCLSYFT